MIFRAIYKRQSRDESGIFQPEEHRHIDFRSLCGTFGERYEIAREAYRLRNIDEVVERLERVS
jgi:hypothetical protein